MQMFPRYSNNLIFKMSSTKIAKKHDCYPHLLVLSSLHFIDHQQSRSSYAMQACNGRRNFLSKYYIHLLQCVSNIHQVIKWRCCSATAITKPELFHFSSQVIFIILLLQLWHNIIANHSIITINRQKVQYCNHCVDLVTT